ncbi:hypothetical protein HMPREF0971_02585 [Segatella oris F0302]|uniref:Uncharacterized protein n=1 Tax=Segatella oris F0302 TaxID=649760 RepID=D1QUA2_9BACT|nr:hypothetical protein HMPREF0971_02585 [Segatella oris F0302]
MTLIGLQSASLHALTRHRLQAKVTRFRPHHETKWKMKRS